MNVKKKESWVQCFNPFFTLKNGWKRKEKKHFSTNSTHNAQGKCLIKQIMTPHPTPLLKEREKTQKHTTHIHITKQGIN